MSSLSSSQGSAIVDQLVTQFGMTQQQAKQCVIADQDGVRINLPFACKSQHDDLKLALTSSQVVASNIHIVTDIEAKKTKLKRLPRVKNVIAVASGKGGVGKSATSVNLAFALQAEGAKVGILDADIYGPSVPIMLGNPSAQPTSEDNRHMVPLRCHDIVANSIGYLVPADNATVWRGPMASKALQQLVNETLWPELDYLIIDMPPGTGDIQLTLAQMVPLTAVVVVTTPQDIALSDAQKGIAMFDKVDIPVLGLVENMSYYQCSNCGHQAHIFASGGAQRLAQKHQVELLGQIPLDIAIREHADGGTPLIVNQPDSDVAQSYKKIARQLSFQLAYTTELENDDRIV